MARHWSSPIRVQGQDPGLDAMLQAALLDQPAGQGRVLPVRHHPAHDVAAVDVHDDVEVVIAPLLRPEQPRDIPGHLVRRRGHQLGLLVLGMGALVPEPAPRRPEHDTSCVRCTGRPLRRAAWPPPRRVSGPRTAPMSKTSPRSVSLNARAGVGRGCCCPVDGPRRRYNVDRETSRAAHAGFTPTCLARSAAFSLSRRRGLSPAAPQLFPAVDDLLSSFSSRAFRLQSYLLIQRISLRLAAAFLRQGLQRPAMRRLRHVVRRTSSPQDELGAPVDDPSLYDGRRRSGLSTRGAAALRLASPVSRGTTILFHAVPTICLALL